PAHIAAGAIHDARHVHDTLSVTGSAKKPISANLVRWSLTVGDDAPIAASAARSLRRDVAAVRAFLRSAGIPAAAISRSVVTSEKLVDVLPHHRRRVHFRVAQQLLVRTSEIDAVEP